MKRFCLCVAGLSFVFAVSAAGQAPAPANSARGCAVSALPQILQELDGQRMKQTVEKLVSFGTRHSLSDTESPTRGAGAARKWILEEMNRQAAESQGRMTAAFQTSKQKAARTGNAEVDMVNVVATIAGTNPQRVYVATGHYDSRNSTMSDTTGDAPGANDDASGVAVIMELARVLSRYPLNASLVFAALEGEEQGLLGARGLAQHAVAQKWDVEGMIDNDMVGNIEGQTGAMDNRTIRVFSANNSTSGDSDSRQFARYIREAVRRYLPQADAKLVYRLDRFGRGGDHRPFFEAGFPAVRFTELNESYIHQHQNVRVENGVQYGDLPQFVSADLMKLAAQMNAAALVSAACAPATPREVRFTGGNMTGNTTVTWAADNDPNVAGYEIVIRDTRADDWEKVIPAGMTRPYTLKSFSPDDVFVGVRAVGKDGTRSPVASPQEGTRLSAGQQLEPAPARSRGSNP